MNEDSPKSPELEVNSSDRWKVALAQRSWRSYGALNFEIGCSLNGAPLKVPLSDRTGLHFFQSGYLAQHFNDVYNVLRAAMHLDPGVVVDVGANIGIVMALTTAIDRSRAYIGFEPSLSCCRYLERFIAASGLDAHMVFPLGLSDSTQVLEFHSNFDADVQSTFAPEVRPQLTFKSVRRSFVCPGDEVLLPLLTELDASVSLVKIDVEGWEYQVLRGLRSTIDTHRAPLVIEVLAVEGNESDRVSDDDERVRHIVQIEGELSRYGYRYFKMKQSGRIEPRSTLMEYEDQAPHGEQNFLAIQPAHLPAFEHLVEE